MKKSSALPDGTKLDAYKIEHLMGGGGFSNVYLATEIKTETPVVIKEYMPNKWAMRKDDLTVTPNDDTNGDKFNQGRTLFFKEASNLVMLDHPCIVKVRTFFPAYGTVYMVMEYHQGTNLQEYIAKHKGGLTEQFILTVFPPLLNGLKVIHELNLLHLDIKPGNIHLRPGGVPLLLDFGASKQSFTSRMQQGGQVVTNGYSPIEQHRKTGYIGPWSDLYAIGATIRCCIEGKSPQPAPDRYEEDKVIPSVKAYKNQYSKFLLEAIDWAMEVDPLLRPQSVNEFLPVLMGEKPVHTPGGEVGKP